MNTQADVRIITLPEPLTGLQVAMLAHEVIETHKDGKFMSEVLFRDDYLLKVGRESSGGTADLLVCSRYTPDYTLHARGLHEDIEIVFYLPSDRIVYPSGCSYVNQINDGIERFMRDMVNAWEIATHAGGVGAFSLDKLLAKSA